MQEKLKAFIENPKVMNVAMTVAALGFAVNAVAKYFMGNPIGGVSVVLMVICIIVTGSAFFTHDKNVYKIMMGATLIWFAKDQITYVGDLALRIIGKGEFGNGSGLVFLILEAVLTVAFVCVFVTHLMLASDHHSNFRAVRSNQLAAIAGIIITIGLIFANLSMSDYSPAAVTEILSWEIAMIGLFIFIVCSEARVEAYKVIRDKSKEA